MAKGRFTAHVGIATMRRLKAKRRLVLDVSADDEADVKEMLRTYEQDAVRRVEAGEQPREVAFEWDIAYGKRSLGKNALTWALLTLTAKLQNEGMPDGQKKRSAQDIYNEDKGEVFPSRPIVMERDAISWLDECDVTVLDFVPIEGTTMVTANVVKTSSKWNDQEAHRYIEHLFNRLAMSGVPLPEDQVRLKTWWLDWMAAIDESRVELHADVLSREQYATLTPLCEGCMMFVGHGGGEVAHIKSVGAGGEEPQLANGAEWLHLCSRCHQGIVHQKGWGEFKKAHGHLANKIDAALAKPATGEKDGTIHTGSPSSGAGSASPVAESERPAPGEGGGTEPHRAADESSDRARGEPRPDHGEGQVGGGQEVEQAELFEPGAGKPPWGDLDPDDPRHPIV